jgi:Zn finger protein HypA/HybF involved in hydrogenase expression
MSKRKCNKCHKEKNTDKFRYGKRTCKNVNIDGGKEFYVTWLIDVDYLHMRNLPLE